MEYPFPFPLLPQEIAEKRKRILGELLAADPGFAETPVRSVQGKTLSALLSLTDRLYLDGFLLRRYPRLQVKVSNRMTSAAGKFIHSRTPAAGTDPIAEIRMSGDFLFRLSAGSYRLNGLTVSSPQEAFLVVFEHETVHAVEYAFFGSTGHSKRFMHLAGGLFGHTGIHHELPTRAQESAAQGLRPGAAVSFFYQGKTFTGLVQRVGKTATVMVPDLRGAYRDTRGRRYAKFRVPPAYLKIL